MTVNGLQKLDLFERARNRFVRTDDNGMILMWTRRDRERRNRRDQTNTMDGRYIPNGCPNVKRTYKYKSAAVVIVRLCLSYKDGAVSTVKREANGLSRFKDW